MIILQEQAAIACRAIVSADCQSARSFRPQGELRLRKRECPGVQGGAQKGAEAIWTAASRPQDEGYGYPESHGGAT